MPVYRVYYATEENQREYTKDSHMDVLAENRIHAYRLVFDQLEFVEYISKFGIVVELPISQAKPTPSADTQAHMDSYNMDDIFAVPTNTKVQVSWWQSGTRSGEFSQQAYPVLKQDDTWVTVSLMGNPKAVRREHTRVAA